MFRNVEFDKKTPKTNFPLFQKDDATPSIAEIKAALLNKKITAADLYQCITELDEIEKGSQSSGTPVTPLAQTPPEKQLEKLLVIEREKLALEREKLAFEEKKLAFKERKLAFEHQKFAFESNLATKSHPEFATPFRQQAQQHNPMFREEKGGDYSSHYGY